MNWYKGDAANAIKLSKDTRSMFIVYIKGDDPISSLYNEFWLSDKVTKLIHQENCVALSINSQGEMFQQFSQIYPVMISPTVYFIGNDGSPLEVIVGKLDLDAFYVKINHALELHKEQLQANSGQESNTDKNSSNDKADHLSIEEKAEKARFLIAEKRAEKERQDREEQRQRELERREMGQGLNKLKQLKADMEMKEAKEEIRKQKEEDKKALDNIRRQLELDRQERAKTFYNAKNLEVKKASESSVKKQKLDDALKEADIAEKMKNARIQFRLPDGSALVQNFHSDQLFKSAYDYIRQNTAIRNCTMSMTFPKREFTSSDQQKSFRDLDLAPSAILIVLPVSNNSSHNIQRASNSVISTIFSPLLMLWVYIYSFLSGLIWPQNTRLLSSNSSAELLTGSGRMNSNIEMDTDSKLDEQRKKNTNNIGLRQRIDGNIHRLTADDDNDENNTYNGNSTQQM